MTRTQPGLSKVQALQEQVTIIIQLSSISLDDRPVKPCDARAAVQIPFYTRSVSLLLLVGITEIRKGPVSRYTPIIK
jgi:hypothetical protein